MDVEQNHLIIHNLRLYKAALNDDWETAERIFRKDPKADSAIITNSGQTLLHIAVGTNSSHRFVENLVKRLAGDDVSKLADCDHEGNSSLHYAARAGNIKAARALVEKYSYEIFQNRNGKGHTALRLAASYRQRNMVVYLIETLFLSDLDGRTSSPWVGVEGGDVISLIITAGFYDIALLLIRGCPNLATEKDKNGSTALQKLATQPKAFPSGRNWWLWKRIIYFCIPLKYTEAFPMTGDLNTVDSIFKITCNRNLFGYVGEFIWKVAKYMVPFLETIHDQKKKHKQIKLLMQVIFRTIVPFDVLGKVMSTATKHGILELVEECVGHYPGLISNIDEEGLNFFMSAIKYRQVKVYNLVYQMTKHVVIVATTCPNKKDNPLHLVGRKPPPYILNDVTGAALQMQRELQWFKAVEKYAEPFFKDALNEDMATPQMIFTDEHKDLVAQGEKWMKDTATSSLVVTALITTVAFAAIFTVPGGNKQESGTPYFLRDSTFMLFASFDALALFSSITSLLMFLAILTSRFAEQDFLYALPKRMTIGLLALFISIAAIMVTFCAALALVLREELTWIAIPVGLLGCVPVGLFTLLQSPLLVKLVLSTYGPSIFRKQNNKVLH